MTRSCTRYLRKAYSFLFFFIAAFPLVFNVSSSKMFAQEKNPTPVDTGFYVFFKKPSNWNQVYLYTWQIEDQRAELIELHGPWPGKALANANGWYRGFIKQNEIRMLDQSVKLIFNDGGGLKTDDLNRSKNGWYIFDNDSGEGQWYDLNPDQKMFEVQVNGGTGSGFYAPGSLVKIQAEPEGQETFQYWQTDELELLSDSYSSATQFQMPANDVLIEASYLDLSNGASLYQSKNCATCHGANGGGGIGPSLLLDDKQCKSCASASELSQRIELTMPVGNVGSCDKACAEEIATFILSGLNQSQDSLACTSNEGQYRKRQLRLVTQREYRNIIGDLFQIENLDALRFWPEASLVKGYDNNADANVVSDRHALVFAKAAKEISQKYNLTDLADLNCQSDPDCIFESAGLRLFRKPLAEETKKALATFWQREEQSWNRVLEIMLQMPQFLYRAEIGTLIAPMGAFRLDDYEIASAISFAIIGSTPDEELLDLAAEGRLKDKETRRLQAQRLLNSEAAKINFNAFAQQWLGISGLPYLTRDSDSFTEEIRQDMLNETSRFFGEKIFNQNANVVDLYLSEETFPSARLASYYGLDTPSGEGAAVSYDDQRLGLLSQGSILANYSNSHEASPIKRGVFVRNRLLCQDLPPPPANVDTTIPPPAPGLTIRERLKRHISQGAQEDGSNTCYSCHQYIDMVGFGFEAFDQTAKFRSFYPEKPEELIDTSGEIKGLESLADNELTAFQSLPELGQKIASSQRSKQCFALQYFRFTSGYIEEKEDRCILSNLQSPLIQGTSIKQFMEEFIVADSFIYRR